MQGPLETPRLHLRPFTPEDFDGFFGIWGDPEVIWWQPRPKIEDARAGFARVLGRQAGWPDGVGWLAAWEKESDAIVGDVILQPAPFVEGIEVGWHFRSHVWNRGYATEAARVVERAFADGVLEEVYAAVATKNRPSQRVAEKLDMRVVKTFERASLEHFLYRRP